ncbi:unnamed protein product [Rhizophagus irregularis]|uniref:Uncharacterized protein n=1 Tax=Rhizophagus irregularis TaxID=588596 RepID=A0A915ZQ38_9GLOM|nr:unnamed protein product [Rhizophagus irregularis]CAB5185241.1 unnamed protein product [Rhizophagus irregularis]CAB5382875.1 unnamed protein product [Rhizophagus irregularis]CAB5382876.1 unnamed protein product [Rhizophagus irregularis]
MVEFTSRDNDFFFYNFWMRIAARLFSVREIACCNESNQINRSQKNVGQNHRTCFSIKNSQNFHDPRFKFNTILTLVFSFGLECEIL